MGIHGFKFPVLVTSTHMIFGSWALIPMMMLEDKYVEEHGTNLREQWLGLAAVALMNGVQIALNNASLQTTELSMNQVVRASIPVLTALAGICIESKVPTCAEMIALSAVSLGVVLCVYQDSTSEVSGIILVAISAIIQCAQMSLSSRLMTKKLSSFQVRTLRAPTHPQPVAQSLGLRPTRLVNAACCR